mmetsp:Transcript_22559/g.56978  ORF Transcript_22559/g.56978 Transcript_22559/m.56978 type:complete len:210 (+) Transcript_22559:552-1181(+)
MLGAGAFLTWDRRKTRTGCAATPGRTRPWPGSSRPSHSSPSCSPAACRRRGRRALRLTSRWASPQTTRDTSSSGSATPASTPPPPARRRARPASTGTSCGAWTPPRGQSAPTSTWVTSPTVSPWTRRAPRGGGSPPRPTALPGGPRPPRSSPCATSCRRGSGAAAGARCSGGGSPQTAATPRARWSITAPRGSRRGVGSRRGGGRRIGT